MYREDGLPAGTVVEGIEIQRLLRADRFVLTYLARDVAAGRSLAVKEYLPRDCGRRRGDGKVEPQTAADAELYEWGLKRFLAEAHLVEQLAERDADRHLGRVERVIEDRGTAYVALEYEAVRTLEESTKAGLPEARVREVLSSIEAGLEHMHASGLYHYDVTPSNVVVRADGTTALLFACGRTRQEMARRCRTAVGVFSPGYAAAEQYDVQEAQDGPWTDIHALGALAYWALSGQAPESVSEQAAEHRLLAVRQASEEGVSDALASALASALARDVRARPRSVEEWRLRSTPHEDEAVPKAVSRPWVRWVMAAALVVLLGLVATWAVVERQLRELAEAELEQASVASVQAEVAGQARESALDGEIRDLQVALQEALVVARTDFVVMHEPGCDDCPAVVVLPGGTFTMGSGSGTEAPAHRKEIRRFALGQTEVTRAQFRSFAATVGGMSNVGACLSSVGDSVPIVCVSWNGARAYVEWLAEKTGRPYRLPSEAEWEYAARAGTTTGWYWGTDEDAVCTRANGSRRCDGIYELAPVMSFRPNPFSLFDMAGNAEEWVADCWHDTYDGAPSDGREWMTTSGPCTHRVVRGGAYSLNIGPLTVTARRPSLAAASSGIRGIRVALSLD